MSSIYSGDQIISQAEQQTHFVLQEYVKKQKRRIQAGVADKPEYIVNKTVSDGATQFVYRFYDQIRVQKISGEALVVGSRIPHHLVSTIFDLNNWSYLRKNAGTDGFKVFFQRVLLGLGIDATIILTSGIVEYTYDQLQFYCTGEGFNTLDCYLQKVLFDNMD
ncbi:MAG: hypothetical protein Q8M03_05455, partial [Legionella sp.]|nr:hypothetical protein [Legionella sp.]